MKTKIFLLIIIFIYSIPCLGNFNNSNLINSVSLPEGWEFILVLLFGLFTGFSIGFAECSRKSKEEKKGL